MEEFDLIENDKFISLAEEQNREFEEMVWPILKNLGWDNPETWEQTS